MADGAEPVRVFVSYAHDDAGHEDRVRDFWLFLRANGLDARLDLPAAEEPRDWTLWMGQQLRECQFVLVVGSPEYKRRAEGDAAADEGRGAQWEAGLIRSLLYADQQANRRRVIAVVLPGCDHKDLPDWLTADSSTYYRVARYSVPGAERLLRVLTGQPFETVPPLGPVPVLASRPLAGPASADEPRPAARSGLRTEVRLEVSAAAQGAVRSEVSLAGTVLSAREARLPADVWQVWQGLRAAPVAAAQRMLSVGRQLAGALFDEPSQRRVADLMAGMPAGDWVDVVLVGDGAVAGLPVELLRLTGSDGAELGPLALLGGVTVSRRLGGPGAPAAGRLPGPVKVLAAVAAPQETLTASLPLDVEAEMHAVLNAVGGLAGGGDGQPAGQVRILEVASLAQITGALRGRDRYHVLHLSAHGSPTSVELEDEDGRPVEVSTQRLVSALRDAGVRLPLIVLSSCHGGSASAQAMAAGLVRAGASRVIAMQTSVTDDYATALTAALYQELASRPDQPVAQALALARRRAEDRPRDQAHAAPPEYGVATLLSAGADGPLVDVHAAPAPLTAPTAMPSGATVRELRLGELIGRRRELRAATAVLRRAAAAVDEHGAIAGVQLLGIGGIGKTALAGRVIGRLRDDGWTVVVHEGRWDPAALFATIAEQVRCLPDAAREAAALASADVADTAKVGLVASLLAAARLLLVFDDFEQNLTPGGAAFADPNLDAVLTEWCDKAERGGLLLTCRYPLPGADRYLVPIQVPPLSASELRRMFLRLPALRALPDEDRRLLSRIIGGHPRLIEYVDALLRGKPARLKQVQAKLRRLAADQGVDLRKPRPLGTAIDQALLLGSADILLEELLGLLTDAQAAIVHQLSVCRAPMTLDDLAYTLELPEDDAARAAQLATDVERLTDLTLLTAGPDVLLHGWTAELLSRRGNGDTTRLHERALATRLRRLQQGRADQLDLLDLARHLAALHQYDEVADLATQAVAVLPGSLAAAAFLADIRALLPSSHRSWIQVTKEEYEAVKAAGNLSQAEALLTAMRQEIDSQTAASPADMFWQSWLSVVIVDLADLATARGDLAGVQKNLTRAHSQATQFASAYVDNHWWQNHSALIRNRLGNVAVAVGDLVGAGEHYQASLTVDEGLVAADPTNTRWRRGVSVSREKLGDVAVAVGDLVGAGEHYQTSLTIREGLVGADPTNTGWRRDVSVSREKLGNVAVAVSDLAGAREHYQASLTIREGLVAADPTNTGWRRDVSVSRNKLGDVAVAVGDLLGAREHYQASLAIRERLVAVDPTNVQWQRDLAYVRQRLTDLDGV